MLLSSRFPQKKVSLRDLSIEFSRVRHSPVTKRTCRGRPAKAGRLSRGSLSALGSSRGPSKGHTRGDLSEVGVAGLHQRFPCTTKPSLRPVETCGLRGTVSFCRLHHRKAARTILAAKDLVKKRRTALAHNEWLLGAALLRMTIPLLFFLAR